MKTTTKKTLKGIKKPIFKSNIPAVMGNMKGKIIASPDCWDDDDVPRKHILK